MPLRGGVGVGRQGARGVTGGGGVFNQEGCQLSKEPSKCDVVAAVVTASCRWCCSCSCFCTCTCSCYCCRWVSLSCVEPASLSPHCSCTPLSLPVLATHHPPPTNPPVHLPLAYGCCCFVVLSLTVAVERTAAATAVTATPTPTPISAPPPGPGPGAGAGEAQSKNNNNNCRRIPRQPSKPLSNGG